MCLTDDIVLEIPQDGRHSHALGGPTCPMPHPPELEAIPTAGSLVGRHLIVREIARGTVGPLFLARTQNENDAIDTLARVIPIPADLPAKDDQLIAEAIWDSANAGHDMVLRVADVVAGKGWVTLVHEYHVGSLLSSMHWRAGDLGSGFPSEIAARIALDVLEGLEQSRGLCEANRIPWRPGSIAMGSLYLCGDGRTRALDGQVMAAVMRSGKMRAIAGTSASIAPEMLDENREPDERTDVFAVGVVLWELLTGREIKVDIAAPVDNVRLAVPKGTPVPQGLVYALHRALDIDPDKRQSTLRELAVELVMGAEKVATYQQVTEFAGMLMPFEMAFRAGAAAAAPATAAALPSQTSTLGETASPAQTTPAVEAEIPSTVQQQARPEQQGPRFASPFAPLAPAPAGMATAAMGQGFAPAETASAHAQTTPIEATPIAGVGTPATLPLASEPSASTASSGAAVGAAPAATQAADNKPQGTRLEQIDWPEEDAAPPAAAALAKKSNGAKPVVANRDPLDTIPGAGAASGQGASKGLTSGLEDPASKVGVNPVIELKPDPRVMKQPEPTTKLARRDSGRPSPTSKSPASTSTPAPHGSARSSARPGASKPVQASALLDNDASAQQSVPTKKSGAFQISATTLILGFSTTVLAVVLLMILLQQRSSHVAPTATVPSTPAVPQANAAPGRVDMQSPQNAPASEGRSPTPTGTSAAVKASSDVPSSLPDVRVVDRHKRPGKFGGTSAKAFGKDDATGDNSKTSKKSGQFVPDEI